jgi:hypothetical protein
VKQTQEEKDYPSPAERRRIIRQRESLLKKLVTAAVLRPDDTRRIDKLVRQYGSQEVMLVLDIVRGRTQGTGLIGDHIASYRAYRCAFARFGSDRSFLGMREYQELSLEHAGLSLRQVVGKLLRRPNTREQKLYDLLLMGVDFWQDITPPAVPPRPADFAAPPPGQYEGPVQGLLTWGWDLDERRAARAARSEARWRPAVPGLVRMALDEGLLQGWPGETSAWAPYHAVHLLGYLHAHEVAGPLLTLLDQENDWLSDQLPAVWARLGPAAEVPLWDYAGDGQHTAEQRSIAFQGLGLIAEAHPARRGAVIDGLVRLLQCATATDATANGYLVHILDRLAAVEAGADIAAAFAQDKVDPGIIQPYDVEFLPG